MFRYLLFFLLISTLAVAQEEPSYNEEFVTGVNFNTNGGIIGGAMFRYARKIETGRFHNFSLEIVNVKHAKERKETSLLTGNVYVYGKARAFFAVRPQYGQEFIVFRKANEDGVQVNAIIAAGPSIGILKPYFIDYSYGTNDIRQEAYDYEFHKRENIMGSSGLLKGFGDSDLALGLNCKAGLTFEFGHFTSNVTGLEIGMLTEAFTKRMVMLPMSENNWLFTSLYLNLYFGTRR
ncbi:MAG TPA: hypothetical protein VIK89_03535 [Cytophagaceae bacterium]